MENIKITVRANRSGKSSKDREYDAAFDPVRSVSYYTIGWATVTEDGYTLKFPAILSRKFSNVYTVSDWQAPASVFAEDLADPEQIAEQISNRQGSFVTGTGADTSVANWFTTPEMIRKIRERHAGDLDEIRKIMGEH